MLVPPTIAILTESLACLKMAHALPLRGMTRSTLCFVKRSVLQSYVITPWPCTEPPKKAVSKSLIWSKYELKLNFQWQV